MYQRLHCKAAVFSTCSRTGPRECWCRLTHCSVDGESGACVCRSLLACSCRVNALQQTLQEPAHRQWRLTRQQRVAQKVVVLCLKSCSSEIYKAAPLCVSAGACVCVCVRPAHLYCALLYFWESCHLFSQMGAAFVWCVNTRASLWTETVCECLFSTCVWLKEDFFFFF